MDNLPDFETPQPSTEPKVRKPRPKPQRKRRVKKAVVVAPKKRVAKKRRARRASKHVVETTPVSRLSALIEACNKIAAVLDTLVSREERSAVMRSVSTGLLK